jgi:hypothetical protein
MTFIQWIPVSISHSGADYLAPEFGGAFAVLREVSTNSGCELEVGMGSSSAAKRLHKTTCVQQVVDTLWVLGADHHV